MNISPNTLVALAIIACVFYNASRRPGPASARKWSLKLFDAIALVVAMLILLNPELLALGLLGDTAFFDLLVLLISLQLQNFGAQIRYYLRVVSLRIAGQFLTVAGLGYLNLTLALAALGTASLAAQKFLHRLIS